MCISDDHRGEDIARHFVDKENKLVTCKQSQKAVDVGSIQGVFNEKWFGALTMVCADDQHIQSESIIHTSPEKHTLDDEWLMALKKAIGVDDHQIQSETDITCTSLDNCVLNDEWLMALTGCHLISADQSRLSITSCLDDQFSREKRLFEESSKKLSKKSRSS
jgi:hypothetical protein